MFLFLNRRVEWFAERGIDMYRPTGLQGGEVNGFVAGPVGMPVVIVVGVFLWQLKVSFNMIAIDPMLPYGLSIELVNPFFWSVGGDNDQGNSLKIGFGDSRGKVVGR